MRPIRQLLSARKRRRDFSDRDVRLDQKSLEKILLNASLETIGEVETGDFKKINLNDQVLFIKTAFPGVASELWRGRERLRKKINGMLGKEVIKEIKIK